MSKDQTNANGENQNPTDDEVKDPKAVLAKNQELLGKLKTQNDKAKALEDELNKIRTEKMAAEGKKDELIEALKAQVENSKKKEAQLGWNIISGQVAVEATKKGCVNVDSLMKLVDFGSASIDSESLSISKDDVNIILEKAVKDHPYLFKSDVKKPRDGGASHSQEMPDDFKTMSKDKLLESYRKLALKI